MSIIIVSPQSRRYARLRFGALACALTLGLTACSQPEAAEKAVAGGAEAASDSAASSESAMAAPSADPNVAPGVAFAYSLAFRLPDAAVADAQERHVAACGALGRPRCRVTGLNYDQDDDGIIRASLSLLVDPALARGYVRDAAAIVDRLDGTLETSSVGGEDVGTGITQSQATSARLGGDIERLRERLRQPGLTANERRDLQAQISALEGSLGDEEQMRRAGETRLAATPVNIRYGGERGLGGLNRERPFASAWEASSESFATASAFVLMVLGLILPWALMLGGIVIALRWLKGRSPAITAAPPSD